mmetsp:Transcript_11932/g.20951  ORF Transcript_11932/g.20951 Transcript_11932/m.20951 type:complete len:138 (+) Transcript_11932:218-631(+)
MAEFFDGDNHVRCGGRLIKIFVLGRNAYKNLGMHPAEMVLIHFGELLETYAGDAEELYNQFGRKLCISASKISRHESEYCHVNTTPDLPIRNAIRASTSLPILWEPCELGIVYQLSSQRGLYDLVIFLICYYLVNWE